MSTEARRGEWRQGWPALVGGASGLGLGYSLFVLTAGIFVKPVQEALDTSRSAVSFGPMVSLITAVLAPFAGSLIDRFGSRRIAIIGMALLAAGLFALATTPAERHLFYFWIVCIGIVGPMSHAMAFTRGVASWFIERRGTAFGIVLGMPAMTTALATPLLQVLISAHGWRAGYLFLAGCTTLGLLIVLLCFRQRDHDSASGNAETVVSGASFHEALADRRFWLLLIVYVLANTPIGGVIHQLQPLLTDNGFDLPTAALLGSTFAISITIGRFITGLLLDRLPPVVVAVSCLSLATVGAVLLAVFSDGPPNLVSSLLGAILLGFALGAEADFIAFFTANLFGMRAYSKLFGINVSTVALSHAAGGLAFAYAADSTGSYKIAIAVSAAMLACSAILLLLIPNINRSRRAIASLA